MDLHLEEAVKLLVLVTSELQVLELFLEPLRLNSALFQDMVEPNA